MPDYLYRSRSLFVTLLAWISIPLLALLLVSMFFAYRNADRLAEVERDFLLQEALDDLAESFDSALRKNEPLSSHSLSIRLLLDNAQDRRYYAIRNKQGVMLAGNEGLFGSVVSGKQNTDEVRFFYSTFQGHPIRVALLTYDKDRLPDYQLMVAETLNARSALAIELSKAALFPQVAILLSILPLIWFGIRRGLYSIQMLHEIVLRRSPKDLTPIPADLAPRELRSLLKAFNELLQRVGEVQDEQRRFIASAAHQIKTPIAVMSGEMDLSLDESACDCAKPALRRLKHSLNRLSHLVRQLLALALAEATEAHGHQVFDLEELAMEVVAEYVPEASRKRIDLGFEGCEQIVPVFGNPVLVREAIKNLVENAIKFTPESGVVTVGVSRLPPTILVSDSGMGIPENYQPLLGRRFQRADEHKSIEGNGLGLSIVVEVARSHRANVSVRKSSLGGAMFEFRFSEQGKETYMDRRDAS